MSNVDIPKVKTVARWRLEKFDGEHVEGDGKKPVEIIEGGDDIPTRVVYRKGEQDGTD